MKKGKTKLTRQDAERLFEGLPGGTVKASSRPENPFEAGAFDVVERIDDESRLWKDNLITLPMAIELPAGYESVSRMRDAMVRAWRVRWVREEKKEVVTEFPEGWKAVRPASGPIEVRDSTGVVRAVYGWAEDAELRILPRYLVESQANSSSGLGSLVVRDRANGQILARSSNWSAQTGTNHPEWAKLSAWLGSHFPHHRDPLRYWDDCEQNIQN
ncbi:MULTISPECIES: hypothetical protein [unclassified Caballeronia]|uniref:hypothetical protein n=1 Tax=unclassified Caballeronia TaxID=2646786 RepID=UPI00285FAA11|nr:MULTISPECIES: hypothetical protein [unclassified Caballeronia]MDR5752855.1 hypothetical protein [Caballeronia sp. LZ024]MDR5841499.1 hypothetical protein [Caballeronia sp. LZ031]